jgi:nucleoside-diphosphate-sugar epimerase
MRHRTGFRSPMIASRWQTLYEVIRPLRDEGLPVITIVPGLLYGPQDGGLAGEIMRWHYRRSPLLAAPESRFSFVHVDDLAAGLRLAAVKGEPGETFLMAGESLSLGEMFALWSSLTGKNHRPIALPARWLRPFAPLVRRVERIIPLPPAFGSEAFALFGLRQQADSTKAQEQLGWQTRSLQNGMLETFRYLATRNEPELVNRVVFGRLGLLAAVALTVLWLFGRKFSPDRSN